MKREDVETAGLAALVGVGAALAWYRAARERERPPELPPQGCDVKIEAPLGPVDDWPQWTPATGCNPVAKPGVVAFRDWLTKSLGGTGQIVRPCGMGDGLSLHHEGRALDWFPPNAATAEALVACLTARADGEDAMLARRAGIPVIIWDRQIWSAGHRTWRPYTGASPHTDHVHFGFSWEGAEGKTSLYEILGGDDSVSSSMGVAAELELGDPGEVEPVILAATKGLEKRSRAYRRKLAAIAVARGLDPSSLAATITIESGHNPAAVNPHSGASGLIQIMPANAPKLGVSLNRLRSMSAIDQLDLVAKWYEMVGATELDRPVDHYLAVFNPAHVGKPRDFVLYEQGSKGYAQNAVLDFDKDGAITIEDTERVIVSVLEEASNRPPYAIDLRANPWVVGLATAVVAVGVAAAVEITT